MALVLVFKNFGAVANMASVHAAECAVVTAAEGARNVVITEGSDEVEDLRGRQYPVKYCKCTGMKG